MIITRRLGPGLLTKGLVKGWTAYIRRQFEALKREWIRLESFFRRSVKFRSYYGDGRNG